MTLPMTKKKTIGQTLNELEDAMHFHLDQPVTGDFMSLTRAWRQILQDFQIMPGKTSRNDR